ncbi:uncharacterized protein [Cherax quadricarinatus]|uniref:uncharacterized protein n=1 Tax=Cherax quadricarinatus TaxID=27406 RepID=UPI0023781E93|nr:uncharacterized protein LOC128685771 [Cherax quadricarinatus]
MGVSPKKMNQGVWVKIWSVLGRAINFVVGCLMLFIAYLQAVKSDNYNWLLVFLIPAVLTLILTLWQRAVEWVEMRAVTSVAVGCLLSFLVFMATRLIHTMTKDASVMLVDNTSGTGSPRPNPLNYPEAWECLSVIMVVGWLKFLTLSSKENLRELGVPQKPVSAVTMLRTLGAVVGFLILGLLTCYMGGVITLPFRVTPDPPYSGPIARFLP